MRGPPGSAVSVARGRWLLNPFALRSTALLALRGLSAGHSARLSVVMNGGALKAAILKATQTGGTRAIFSGSSAVAFHSYAILRDITEDEPQRYVLDL
jgi:hypothetical protein